MPTGEKPKRRAGPTAKQIRYLLAALGEQLPLAVTSGSEHTKVDVARAYLEEFRRLGWKAGSVFWWDDERQRLACLAHVGYRNRMNYVYLKNDRAMTPRIARTGKAICATRKELLEKFPDDYRGRCGAFLERGLKNLLAVPLISDGKTAGVLKFENQEFGRLTERKRTEYLRIVSLCAKMLTFDLRVTDACVIKTKSPKMREALRMCHRCAGFETDPVLLIGEDGSGKTMLAEFIRRHTSRRRKHIEKLQAARVSQMIVDHANRIGGERTELDGIIEANRKGTIFLTDVDELEMAAQSFLEDLAETLASEGIQLIATTKYDPQSEEGDRFDRGAVANLFGGSMIEIPTLAEREADIELLSRHFAEELYFGKGIGQSPSRLEADIPRFAEEVRRRVATTDADRQVEDLRIVVERSSRQQKPLLASLTEHWGPSGPENDFKRLDAEGKEKLFMEKFARKEEEGWSNKRLAEELGVTERTVHRYIHEVLKLSSRAKSGNGGEAA